MESQTFLSWPELLKQVALNKYKFGNQTSKSTDRNSENDSDESSSSTSSSSSSSNSTSGSSEEASSSDSTSSSTSSSSSSSDSSSDSSDDESEKNGNTFKNNYRKLPISAPLSICNELAELSSNQQPLTNSFKLLFCNINSVSSKIEDLKEILLEHQPEIVCISETWLNEKLKNKNLAIDGYYFHRNDREKQGGGLLTYVKNEIPSKLIKSSNEDEDFEYQVISAFNIILVNFYRTQDVDIYSKVELLGQIADKYEKIIVVGDLNVNFLSSDYKTKKCQEIFNKSYLSLRSREATRGENGNDWTLTKGISAYVTSKDTHLSDHNLQIIKCFVKNTNNYHCL